MLLITSPSLWGKVDKSQSKQEEQEGNRTKSGSGRESEKRYCPVRRETIPHARSVVEASRQTKGKIWRKR